MRKLKPSFEIRYEFGAAKNCVRVIASAQTPWGPAQQCLDFDIIDSVRRGRAEWQLKKSVMLEAERYFEENLFRFLTQHINDRRSQRNRKRHARP